MSLSTATSTSSVTTSLNSTALQAIQQIHSAELLSLLLAPDLEESLSPGALVGVDNDALFRLLPLILAAIHKIGSSPTRRDRFVGLVSILRLRIASCRGLKLRFLLLIRNAEFAKHWEVRLIHRRDCYTAARLILAEKAKNLHCVGQSDRSFEMAKSLRTFHHKAHSKDVDGWETNQDLVVEFAISKLLHREHGIRTRNIKWHMRLIKNAFYSYELVDGIMERANFEKRDEAVAMGQRMLDLGIIHSLTARGKRFTDERRRVYQSRIATQRDDEGHCKVVTTDGKELGSWEMLRKHCGSKVSQIEVQLPMDLVDLQSYSFWTDSVYVKGLEKGYRYGYRAIAHPMHCLHAGSRAELVNPPTGFNGISNGSDAGSSIELTSDESLATTQLSLDEINTVNQDEAVVGSVVVRKVFSSIARPMIIELRVPMEGHDLDEEDSYIVYKPGLLVKEGDNLMQDLGVEIMFQCFNHVWAQSPLFEGEGKDVPFSWSYEVFPTSPNQGFMEAVTGLTSLKEYDWHMWRNKYGKDPARVNEMVRSTVGAYVGTYVCGGRDRHFDNVLIKDDRYLLHIDFGFLMGTSPPIDGPRIAIAPQMEAVFRSLKVWDKFVTMFVDAFIALRRVAPAIVRTSVIMFAKAGYEEGQIRSYLTGKLSLNVHDTEKKAAELVRKQIVHSSTDIKTRFKAFAHEHIDPAWYGLLEKGFPPAVAIMKIVDAKEQKAAKRLAHHAAHRRNVSEDEKIHL